MTEFDYTAEGVLRIHRGQKQRETAPVVKRVAAYCRVSTDLEEQQSSLATQMESFQELVASHMGWELAGIYADGDTPYGLPAKGRCIAILPKVARFDVFPYGSESRRYWCLP